MIASSIKINEVIWFNYRSDKSDLWNVEHFMRELPYKIEMLLRDSNLLSVLKQVDKNDVWYQALTDVGFENCKEKIKNYFIHQKSSDMLYDTNDYYNQNIGKLSMMALVGDELKQKAYFINSQWNLIKISGNKINVKSYEVLARLASFLSALATITAALHLAFTFFSNIRFFIEIIHEAIFTIFHRLNGNDKFLDEPRQDF